MGTTRAPARARQTAASAEPAGLPARGRSPRALAAAKTTSSKQKTTNSKKVKDAAAALVAAAEVLKPADRKRLPGPNSLTRTWQHAAFGYVNIVPELGAASLYVGNCLSRVKLVPGVRRPDGTVERIPQDTFDKGADGKPIKEPPDGITEELYNEVADAIATLRSKIGGQSELLRSYAEKMFIAGECFLIPEDTPAGPVFEVLSPMELAKDGDHYVRYLGPGTDPEHLDADVAPLRIHRPDAQFSRLATSSVRFCLEVLEELVILSRLVRSSAISRFSLSGVLAIADEFDDPVDESEPGPDGQQAEQTNPLAVDIINAGARAIDDPASAAAWLPYVFQGPKELIKDGINYIQFKHDDAALAVKRQEAIERLASGLDLPRESVLGHGDTTFANAGKISEDRFQVHLEPTCQMFTDAATLSIIWPTMALGRGLSAAQVEEGGYPEELLQVAVTYDPDDLVAKPDRSDKIVEVFLQDDTQTAVRLSEARDALGLAGDGAPDDEEVRRRAEARRLANSRVLPAGEQPDPIDGAVPGITAAAPARPAMLSLAERIIGGAEVTLERVAERLGSAARNKAAKSDPASAALIDGIANSEVTRSLGPLRVAELLGPIDSIVAAELAALSATVERQAQAAGAPDPIRTAAAARSIAAAAVHDRLFGSGQVMPAFAAAALESLGS